MAVGHEIGYEWARGDRVLPSWRVVLSAWLIVGFVVLFAIGVNAALSRFTVSYHADSPAQLVIPRHDPNCGANVPAAVNGCSGVDPALLMQYSQF